MSSLPGTNFIYFAEKFIWSNINSLLPLLHNSSQYGGKGILIGHLYERFAHEVIARGGDFQTRNLITGEISVLHLEPKRTIPLHTVDHLPRLKIDEYGLGDTSFPGIDAVVCDPPSLFKMIVPHKKKDLNGSEVRSVFDHLPQIKPPYPLFWVMPPDRFDEFQEQSIVGMGREEQNEMIEQFALQVAIAYPQPSVILSSKRKVQEKKACESVIQSGANKGKKCGLGMPCQFHQASSKKAKK